MKQWILNALAITSVFILISFLVVNPLNQSLEEILAIILGWSLVGLIIGLFGWVVLGLTKSITIVEFEVKKAPNQGICKSIKNTFCCIIFSLIYGLISTIFSIIILRIFRSKEHSSLVVFMSMLFWLTWISIFLSGLVSAWRSGGKACLQHFTLRLILYGNGYIPWNYARFLDYCTERLFLQRVGGRYRFIHKLVQEHFAQLEFERK